MSIRAMNWAMHARTDGVSAQCVLFVVADTANEHGVSIHADPDYIADRTRQSRATVFRRLKELEAVGALTRFKHYREDGSAAYEVRLALDAVIDYDVAPDASDAPDLEAKSQIETPPKSQIETSGISPVRQAESQSCDSSNPSKSPEEVRIPPTPQAGGEWPHEASWKEFEEAYREPILRQSQARAVWTVLSDAERDLATRAARGYASHRSRQKKPPNVLNAHTFLKERDAWAAFVAQSSEPKLAALEVVFVPEDSPEWRAHQVIRMICGIPPLQSMNYEEGRGVRLVPLSPAELALEQFADQDPQSWPVVAAGTQMCGAWRQFLRVEPRPIIVGTIRKEYLPGKWKDDWPIKELGLRVPCDWPPRKDGSLSAAINQEDQRKATQ